MNIGYFDSNSSQWMWQWINLPYYSDSKMRISDVNMQTNPYLYVEYNNLTSQYEYGSSNSTATYNFICEAQSKTDFLLYLFNRLKSERSFE